MSARRRYKFRWPSSEQIGSLRHDLDDILAVIAEVSAQPGVRQALVTDLTSAGDFFYVPTNPAHAPPTRA